MRKLSEQEANFAAEKHSVVEKFLRKYRLDESEYYDVIIFRFLRSVQLYLECEYLQELAFEAIAWKAMAWAVKTYHMKLYRESRRMPLRSLDYGDGYLKNCLEACAPDPGDVVEDDLLEEWLLGHLKRTHRTALEYRMQGYTNREISKRLRVSRYNVDRRFAGARDLLRQNNIVVERGNGSYKPNQNARQPEAVSV